MYAVLCLIKFHYGGLSAPDIRLQAFTPKFVNLRKALISHCSNSAHGAQGSLCIWPAGSCC